MTLKKQAAETTDNDRVVKLEEEVTSLKEEREEMLTAYNAVQQQQLASAEIQQVGCLNLLVLPSMSNPLFFWIHSSNWNNFGFVLFTRFMKLFFKKAHETSS